MADKNQQTETTEAAEAEVKAKKDLKQKDNVKGKKDQKKSKDKKQSRVVKRVKETASELKKVTWPTFFQVVKKTGVVLAVVLIFAVVLFGFDRLLAWLFDLLTNSIIA